ncbi:hypothetical protein ACUN0C_09380 [Faunimonas sp. B44]|uniref:hypothetical protein n=1 Tax=Faunimonas sp. B44 TaxID=3461493 RepID=UPI00404397BE
MAKKKKKKSGLPKTIAGVKIPKEIRKGAVGQFIASPAGQAMIGEMLFAAVAAFRNSGSRSKLAIAARHPAATAEFAASKAADVTSDAIEALRERTASLSEAFGEAARQFIDTMAQGAGGEPEETDRSGERPSRRPRAAH